MISHFLMGGIAVGCGAVGLFFLRFWVRSRDPLFLFFSAAFWLMAVGRVALSQLDEGHEARPYAYGLRLMAFVLIIVAIVHKNRGTPSRPGP
jgi:hypothetical protein